VKNVGKDLPMTFLVCKC